MHSAVFVMVPREQDEKKPGVENIRGEVEKALLPWKEVDDRRGRPWGKWDGWVIGGCYTGGLDGYDPLQDPRNSVVTCSLCTGAGVMEASTPSGENLGTAACPICRGSGKRISSDLVIHEGDVQAAENITEDFLPFAVIDLQGAWHQTKLEEWVETVETRREWGVRLRELLQKYQGTAWVVLVDYHF